MAPHSSSLAWKSHGWRSLVGCSSWGSEESDTTGWLHLHFSLSCIGEGNGNPLQCSCLENPRDGGACWAAVNDGVSQSQTRLKQLSSSSMSMGAQRVEHDWVTFISLNSATITPLLYLPVEIWELVNMRVKLGNAGDNGFSNILLILGILMFSWTLAHLQSNKPTVWVTALLILHFALCVELKFPRYYFISTDSAKCSNLGFICFIL